MEQLFDVNAVLETGRLKLRFIDEEDAGGIFRNICHDREVLRCFVTPYLEREEEALPTVRRFKYSAIQNRRYMFSIVLKETDEVIGMMLQCSVPDSMHHSTELGYAIGREYWNRGYGTEALKAMIDFMFSLDIHKVYALHFSENKASGRIMAKCGMIYGGHSVDDLYYEGEFHDTDTYYLINPAHMR